MPQPTYDPSLPDVYDHWALVLRGGEENSQVITNSTLPTDFPNLTVTKGRAKRGISHSPWGEQDSVLAPDPYHDSIPFKRIKYATFLYPPVRRKGSCHQYVLGGD